MRSEFIAILLNKYCSELLIIVYPNGQMPNNNLYIAYKYDFIVRKKTAMWIEQISKSIILLLCDIFLEFMWLNSNQAFSIFLERDRTSLENSCKKIDFQELR